MSIKVNVIGLGYVGLPTAAVIASHGMQVHGVDVNQRVVDTVNAGRVHIVEPDLDALVRVAVSDKQLVAAATPVAAEVFIIAVPTPFKEHFQPDMKYIEAAAKSIAPVLKKGNLVILESTSPVGSTEQLSQWLAKLRPDLSFPTEKNESNDVAVCYCPERILPGRVLTELVENDRILGGINLASAEQAKAFYQRFVKGECLLTNARTAELAKLTENAYRDVNVAFANELSMICDELNINVWQLIELTNRHPRVNVLRPGVGVGGHCIAVDPWFIVAASSRAKLIKTAREVNNSKPEYAVDKIFHAIKSPNDVIVCLGLSYKPNIDDLRESPAVDVVRTLATKLSNPIWVVEPHIESLPAELSSFKQLRLISLDEVSRAHVVAGLVAHRQFESLRESLSGKAIIDVCGVFEY